VSVRLHAPEGGVQWVDASGPKPIEAGTQWTISDGAAPEIVPEPAPPEWLDREPVSQRSDLPFATQESEQVLAAPKIEATLVSNRPVDHQLLEMFQSFTQREVKSLAAKSCVHVGEFSPFVEALRDSRQRANWPTHITTLRGAMAMSPESALEVKQALDEQRGRVAADVLFEMLCGYGSEQIGQTPEQVKTGALAQLINRLEEDNLDYRVLAVHNLKEITGKQLMEPTAPERDRARSIQVWRKRLADGELQPATPR
jgi:hypothetical protein